MIQHIKKEDVFNIVTYIKAIAICMVVYLHNSMAENNELNAIISQYLLPLRMPVLCLQLDFYISMLPKRNILVIVALSSKSLNDY